MRPINLVVANAVGVTTGERNGERVLRKAAQFGSIVALVEADDVNQRDDTPALDPDQWRVIHRPHHNLQDGCLIALERARVELLGNPQWHLGTWPVRNGRPYDIRARWVLRAHVRIDDEWERSIAAGHLPPKDCAPLWPGMATRMREMDVDHLAGDYNRDQAQVRRAFPGRRVQGTEVMLTVSRKDSPTGQGRRVHLAGSDHPGFVLPLLPPRNAE